MSTGAAYRRRRRQHQLGDSVDSRSSRRLIHFCGAAIILVVVVTGAPRNLLSHIPSNDAPVAAAAVNVASVPSTSDQKVQQDISSWPGIPSRTLKRIQDEMKLVRIGPDAGPIEDSREFLLEHLDEFLEVYKNRPDKSNICGIRITHSLAVWTIAKRLQPTTIIESGVNSGQSTYFFRKACPTAKIISIDPESIPICGQPVRWIDTTNNEYLTGDAFVDFDAVNWGERIRSGEIDPKTTLAFIDDHRGFFHRMKTFAKHGFRHLMNEDNYILGEGATRPDKIGLTPKQMFEKPESPDTEWLFHNLKRYAEFPPIIPPVLSKDTDHAKKAQGGFLHKTDDLTRIEEPLLRPDTNEADRQVFEKIAQALGLDPTLVDAQSYTEVSKRRCWQTLLLSFSEGQIDSPSS